MARTRPGHWPLKQICAALAACFAQTVAAAPSGGTVVSGSATFVQNGTTLTVTNSNRAIINWPSFSIGAGETVRFDQAATSSVLNRVVGVNVNGRLVTSPSEIRGVLQSQGQVFLINPAGILIGVGAVIDVAGFVASTLTLSDADFLANHLRFSDASGTGKIQNFGEIRTSSGGNVYLVAPNVENHGIITAPNGEIILAAGKSVELFDSATPGVKVAVTAGGEALNVGRLMVESGRIGMVGAVVKQQGTASADSIVREGGRIFLKASQTTELAAGSATSANGTKGGTIQIESGDMTLVSGAVSAIGSSGSGGRIELLGEKVGLLNGAQVNASGTNDGGAVLVGGDYQGKNADIRNASVTYVDRNTVIKADATDTGDGGKIIVWADDTTRAYGSFSAKGGANGGNGGLVETSGHRYLDIAGARVDTTAARGNTGQWLLDPGQVDIVAGSALTNISGGPSFTPSGGVSTLGTSDINAMLAASNVTITTVGGSGGTGDITLTPGATINYNAGVARTLSLTAENDIVLQGTIQNTSTGGGLFAIDLNAGNGILTPSGQSFILAGGAGTAPIMMQINGGKTWNNYGNVTFNGQSQVHLHDGSSPAAFHNKPGATFVSNSVFPTGFPFYSSASDDGDVSNWGVFTLNQNSAIEGTFTQYAGGTLNIANTKSLNLQEALNISGTVNLNATGALNLTENHGSDANFTNVVFSGSGGALNIDGGFKTANFTDVDAGNVNLSVGNASGGIINVSGGYAVFKSVAFGSFGSLGGISNGWLGVKSDFAIPGGTPFYSGDIGFYSTGALTVANPLSAPSQLDLIAGWNGTIGSKGVVGGAGKDLIINSWVDSGYNMTAKAGNDILIGNTGITSDAGLYMAGGSGGAQTITALNQLTLTASTGTGGSAILKSDGTQTISANGITLNAGSGTTPVSAAKIKAGGSQTITTTAGNLTLQGGGADINNGAEIESDTSQLINIAGNLNITGGSAGDAVISAPTQNISVGGTLTLQGGSGTVVDSYGMAAPAAIGYDNNANITLNVGSSILLSGTDNLNPALIGAAVGVANIYMRGTDINLGNYSFLGNWDGSLGGNATLVSTGTAIQQLLNGSIGIRSLTATSNTDIALNGINKVDFVDLNATTGGGLISYHTANTAATHITAAATGNITVIGDPGSDAIALGTLTTAGVSTASVTSQKAILDDNGSGVANITTGSGNITLVSVNGTAVPGQLAISSDIATSGQVNASVSGGPNGSIYVRDVGASQPTNVTLNASAATTEGDVSYYRYGNLNLSPSIAMTPKAGVGSSDIGASGDINVTGAFTMGGATTSISAGGDFNVLNTVTMNGADNAISAGGNMNLTTGDVVMNGANSNTAIIGSVLGITGGSTLQAGAGKPLDVTAGAVSLDSGTLFSGGDMMLVTPGDVTMINGSSLASGTGKLTFLANNMSITNGAVSGYLGVDGTLFGNLTLGAAAGGTGYMTAGNGIVDLAIGGSGIEMFNGSYINSTDPTQSAGGQINIFFASLSAGGSMIDGFPTFDGGYKVGGSTLATLGNGLDVTYGVLSNPVSDAMIAAMNSTANSGGGTSTTYTSLGLLGIFGTGELEGTQTVGGTAGSFGGTEFNSGNNQGGNNNAKKKFGTCGA